MSIQLKKIIFHNYKCFRDKEIQFQKYNSLVGINGIGKSTILDGIFQITKKKLESKTKNNQAGLEEKQSIQYFFEINHLNNKNMIFGESDFQIELNEEGIHLIDLDQIKIKISSIKIQIQEDTIIRNLSKEINEKLDKIGSPYHILHNKREDDFEIIPKPFIWKEYSIPLSNLLIHLKEIEKVLLDFGISTNEILLSLEDVTWVFNQKGNPEFLALINSLREKLLQNLKIIYLDNNLAAEKLKDVYNFTAQSDSFGILRVFREFDKNSENVFKENDFASRLNYIETFQEEFNKFIENMDVPIIEFQLEFQYVNENLGILMRDLNKKLINLDFLSSGQQWLVKFTLFYYTQLRNTTKKYYEETSDAIILIDEPGQTLHPKAQKVVAEYLQKFSNQHQIIFATHFPDLLNYNDPKSIILLERDNNNQIIHKDFKDNNKLFVLDILKTIEPIEAASIISQENYKLLDKQLMKEISECSMVINVHEEVKNNISEIRNLGTAREKYDFRVIHDAQFLTTLPKRIISEQTLEKNTLKNLVLIQIIKNEGKIKQDPKDRFTKVLENWNNDKIMDVCKYGEKQKSDKMEKILQGLENYKQTDPSLGTSIFLFPECSIPYDFVEELVHYGATKGYIIIAGMEHIKFKDFKKKVEKLKRKYNLDHNISNYPDYNLLHVDDENYINATAIIWPVGNIIFQIKNNPAKGLDDYWENIGDIPEQTYYIVETHLGNIAVFICKDFLVNYPVLPKWMEINNVDIIAIPSFTPLVGPFLSKLREISYSESNKGKCFLYTNLAEYGGSDILNYEWRHSDEPNGVNNFNRRNEIIIDFDLSKKFGKENPKKIKLEN